MKKNFLLLLISITITSVVSCSSNEQDNGAYSKSSSVNNELSKTVRLPWREVDNGGSDLALNNQSTNSFFIFNSACRKYDPSNLPGLTNSILTSINNVEIQEKTMTTYQGRDAVMLIAKGSLDGVQRFFRILTTQKNNCIYDFALIATSKINFEKDSTDFNNFTQLIKLN